MTDQKLFGPERKPWESAADARLAPSSYAAGAVFGLTGLAMETIHAAGHPQAAGLVSHVLKIFARVTIRVHQEVGSGGGWDSLLHTRLRGALRTALALHPMPASPETTSEEWEGELYGVVLRICKAANWLYHLTPEELELT